jgi:hypothetical protein
MDRQKPALMGSGLHHPRHCSGALRGLARLEGFDREEVGVDDVAEFDDGFFRPRGLDLEPLGDAVQ